MSRQRLFGMVSLLALMVAMAAAASVYGLARWARRSAAAELQLVMLQATLQRLDSLEWQAIGRKRVETDLATEIADTKRDANERLALIDQFSGSGDTPHAIGRLTDIYISALDQEVALIKQGKFEAAERFDEEQVDPAFDALSDAIDAQIRIRERSKNRVARYADLGMLFAMLTAAGVISALFLIFSRAREIERAKLEETAALLRQSEERWQFALSGAGLAVWDRNLRADCEYTSRLWANMLGYSADESFDRTIKGWEQSIHADDLSTALQQLQDLKSGKIQHVTMEYRAQHRAGHWIWVLSRGVAAEHDVNGVPTRLIGVREDVTETKLLRDQLAQTQKMQTIGQLAGGIAHDFNNNLTAMMMSLDMLEFELDRNLSESARSTLRDLGSMAERAAKTTAQLLLFARRQSAQMKWIDIGESIGKMSSMLRRLIGERIELQIRLPETAILVRADANLVDQALLNLVVNARDAMPSGGKLVIELGLISLTREDPKLDPEVAPGTFARISVTDAGVGITPEVMPHLFEPFFTTKDVGKGTGLGLASVHGMAHQHQGWVSATSELGMGSVFDIYLPVRSQQLPSQTDQISPSVTAAHFVPAVVSVEPGPAEHFTPLPQPAWRQPADGISQSDKRDCILIAEDEPQVRESIVRMLKHLGHETLVAENAEQALALWQKHQDEIDLLLTDLMMPGRLNGLQLAQEIHQQRADLPIVIMSGYSADAMTDELARHMHFLAKPFDIQTFQKSLRFHSREAQSS